MLEDAIRDLVQAIALDRAYQIAAPYTCNGCGLPAVRFFRLYSYEEGFHTCGCCRPPRRYGENDVDRIVKTFADLMAIGPEILNVSEQPTAFVRSTEQVFVLEAVEVEIGPDRVFKPDGISSFASFEPNRAWFHERELCDAEPMDHPKRKAIERCLRGIGR
jgi:hypothetical protein